MNMRRDTEPRGASQQRSRTADGRFAPETRPAMHADQQAAAAAASAADAQHSRLPAKLLEFSDPHDALRHAADSPEVRAACGDLQARSVTGPQQTADARRLAAAGHSGAAAVLAAVLGPTSAASLA